jgi:tetratricopeptide (TPR) repeat protein
MEKSKMRQHVKRRSYLLPCILIASINFVAAEPASNSVSTAGSCSPVVTSSGGTVAIDIKCPINVVSNFSYRLDSTVAQSIASHFNVTDIAISNFFSKINEENVPPYMVAQRLEKLAAEINRLRKELAAISVSGSSSELWNQTRKALDDGQIDLAIQLHQRIIAETTSAADRAFATILDNVRVRRSLGELYVLTYKYDNAVEVFQQAAEMLPPKFNVETARLKTLLAEALYEGSNKDRFAAAAREAVSAARPIQYTEPEIYLRALGTLLRAQLAGGDAKGALTIFSADIEPLLKRDELLGSSWGVFCFSCAGKAFIDLEDYRGARKILEDGLAFAKKQIVPDKISLASLYMNLSVVYRALGEREKDRQALYASKELFVSAFPDENIPDLAFVYLNIARRADEAKEKEDAYNKAFGIVARTLPYTHGTYGRVLLTALEDVPEYLPVTSGGRTMTIKIGVELSDGFYEALYDRHMSNVRTVTQDREKIARASVDFAAELARNKQYERSVPYYERTIALYSDGGIGESLGLAEFEEAQILEEFTDSDIKKIDKYYNQALQIYGKIFGNTGMETQRVRFKLVDFYLKRSNVRAARELVQQLEQSIGTAAVSPDAKSHLAALKSKLAKK